MITITDFDGFIQNIEGSKIINVSPFGSGSQIYVYNSPDTADVYPAVQSPSALSALTPFVAPITVIEGGTSYTAYLNPQKYIAIQPYGSNYMLMYQYVESEPKQIITSTPLATLLLQQVGVGTWQSTGVLNISTSTYQSNLLIGAQVNYIIYGPNVMIASDWTFDDTTGTVTFTGGALSNLVDLIIIYSI